MPEPSILVLPVNYNDEKRTMEFLDALAGQKGPFALQALVVDNSEPPRTPNPLAAYAREKKTCSVVVPPKNLGYYGGAAFGLKHFLKSAPLPDWVAVSNTDLSFPDPTLFAQLVERHSSGPFDAVAPSIVSAVSGRDQNPYMKERPSRLRMHAYKWMFRIPLFYRLYEILAGVKARTRRRPKRTAATRQDPVPIYAPQGSIVMFRRSWFEAGGTLEHGTFLYGEEITVAEVARRLKLRIGYDPGLELVHEEHSTTGHSRHRAKYSAQAARYLADAFFSGSQQ